MKQKMNNPAEPGVNPYGSAGITQASLRLKMCSINPTMIPVCFAPIPVYPGGEIIISHHLVKLFTRSSQTGTPTKEHTLSRSSRTKSAMSSSKLQRRWQGRGRTSPKTETTLEGEEADWQVRVQVGGRALKSNGILSHNLDMTIKTWHSTLILLLFLTIWWHLLLLKDHFLIKRRHFLLVFPSSTSTFILLHF